MNKTRLGSIGAIAATGALVGGLLMTAVTGHAATASQTLSGGSSLALGCSGSALSWSQTDATDGVATCAPTAATTGSLFPSTATPANAAASDGNAVELGVRFTPSTDGTITGVQFYKGAGNTGTHVGSLWDSAGDLLASGTFTGETSTGWQQLTFATPVAVTAGTTYVAGYYAPAGHYAYTSNYFTIPVTTQYLTAPAADNGVFTYGRSSAFPSSTYNSTNYWVDVTFVPGSAPPPPPTTTTVPVTTTTVPATTTTTIPGTTTTTVPATTTTTVAGNLPPGVTLQAIDGGPNFWSQWPDGFSSSPSFFPIGVFPFELSPASLAGIGINYGTPMRNDNAGTFTPVFSGAPNGNDMTHVNAQPGFYGGADFESEPGTNWGSQAAFNVFGDELDGQCSSGLFSNTPSNVAADVSKCASFGGTSAAGLEAANKDTLADDPSRPVYDQVTGTYTGLIQDGSYGSQYSAADQKAICASTDIMSFDLYPVVKRGEPVYDMFNDVAAVRADCGDNVPVFPFVEMDHMDGGNTYPTPAQTEAEVWDAIIAGARGIQYFDQYDVITGDGAMTTAIKATNAELTSLAPVINSPFANGYVKATGAVNVMAKDAGGNFTVFAGSKQSASQSVTFTVAGAPSGTVTVIGENRTLQMVNGTFTDSFASANSVHLYQMP